MPDLDTIQQVYLPYLGHVLMGLGYAFEQLDIIEAPIPSAVVLIGHFCVLADPRALSPDKSSVRIINLIFLISNILVFIYDFIVSMDIPLRTIFEMELRMENINLL